MFYPLIQLLTPVGPALALAACGAANPQPAPSPSGPVIASVTPSTGLAGLAYPVEIVLTGHGFAQEGNVVRFGDIVVGEVPATAGGTRIVFQAPKERPGRGEAPPMVLLPGRYPITVTTGGQVSNSIDFSLTRG